MECYSIHPFWTDKCSSFVSWHHLKDTQRPSYLLLNLIDHSPTHPAEFNIWSTALTDCGLWFTGSTTCSRWNFSWSDVCDLFNEVRLDARIRPLQNSQKSRKSIRTSFGFRQERLFLKDGFIGPFRIMILHLLNVNLTENADDWSYQKGWILWDPNEWIYLSIIHYALNLIHSPSNRQLIPHSSWYPYCSVIINNTSNCNTLQFSISNMLTNKKHTW